MLVARKCVGIYTPNGFVDQSEDVWGCGADEAQTHRSGWKPDDFCGVGFNETHIEKVVLRKHGEIEMVRSLWVANAPRAQIAITDDQKNELNEFIDNTSQDPTYQTVKVGGTTIKSGRAGSEISWNNIRNSGISFYNKSVCDIGCFNGFFSFRAEETGAKEVVGFDVNAPAIETCNKLKVLRNSNCQFIGREFGNKWFFDRQFDVVMSFNMLHHVRKKVGLERYRLAIRGIFEHCREAIFEIYPQDNEIIEPIAKEFGFIQAKTILGHRHGRVVVYYAPWFTTKKIHLRNVRDFRGKNLCNLMAKRIAPLTAESCFNELDKVTEHPGWERSKKYNPALCDRIFNNITSIESNYNNNPTQNQPVHDLCLDTYDALMDLCDFIPRSRPYVISNNEAYILTRDYLRLIDCFNAIRNGVRLPPIGMRKDNILFQGHFRCKAYIAAGFDGELDYFDEPDYNQIDEDKYVL
jgi:SAM-dependent methyltransferase